MAMNRGDGDYDISNPNFCDDILCEILSRLRVKSLLRFKCTCKHWQSLIESPCFVELHLTRSKSPSLIMTTIADCKIDLFLVEDFWKGQTAVECSRMISQNEEVLRSVNGLFCMVKYADCGSPSARIYNPSTRQISTYPIRKTIKNKKEKGVRTRVYQQYGFGFDPATKEHKVICILEIRRGSFRRDIWTEGKDEVVCMVLTVEKNTKWRRIDEVPPYLLQEDLYYEKGGYYANGSIYWRIRKSKQPGKHIVAFDVGSEKFRVITYPSYMIDKFHVCRTLFEVDECLALLDRISDHNVKLWIYNDVDKKVIKNTTTISNWIEETISLPFSWDGDIPMSVYAVAGTDLIFLKLPDILFEGQRRRIVYLYYYDRKKKTSGKVNITNAKFIDCVETFVESLWPVFKQH